MIQVNPSVLGGLLVDFGDKTSESSYQKRSCAQLMLSRLVRFFQGQPIQRRSPPYVTHFLSYSGFG